jgi:hypothetical protein
MLNTGVDRRMLIADASQRSESGRDSLQVVPKENETHPEAGQQRRAASAADVAAQRSV